MTNVIDRVKLKRGPSGNVAAASLERGEPAISLDTKELWVGDGTGKIKISDTLFYNTISSFPATGQENKIYVAKDTAGTYIWDPNLLQYIRYELTGESAIVQCRVRMASNVTFPSSWQDISYPTKDSETEPTKLYHDPTNQDRIVFNEAGYYRVSYGIVYDVPIVGAGTESDIDCTVSSRINKKDSNYFPASLNENIHKMYFVHRGLTDTLTNEIVEYFDVGDWVSIQIMAAGDPAYARWSDLEVYKVDSIKGDTGDPGSPGSIWHNDSGVPLLSLGNDNDYYHNNDNGDVYNKQVGSWILVSNIIGSTGPTGPPGEAFQIDEYDDLDEAKITSIESGSGASPTDLFYFLVLDDNRSNQTLPNSLNGDMTRHVVMYDGIGWYDFGPFTGIEGPQGPAGSGLSEVLHSESATEQQTTNDQFQEKVSLSAIGLTGGEYRIGWYYEWRLNSVTRDFKAQVQVDDTLTIMSQQQEAKDSGADQMYPASGFAYVNLTAGDHNIDLDWCCANLGDTATIRRARLEIWKVS